MLFHSWIELKLLTRNTLLYVVTNALAVELFERTEMKREDLHISFKKYIGRKKVAWNCIDLGDFLILGWELEIDHTIRSMLLYEIRSSYT